MKFRAAHASALAALLAVLIAPVVQDKTRYDSAENKATLNANAKALIDYLSEDQMPGTYRDLSGWPKKTLPELKLDMENHKLYQLDDKGKWVPFGSLEKDQPQVRVNPLPRYYFEPVEVLTPYVPGSSEYVIDPYTPGASEVVGTKGFRSHGTPSGLPVTMLLKHDTKH